MGNTGSNLHTDQRRQELEGIKADRDQFTHISPLDLQKDPRRKEQEEKVNLIDDLPKIFSCHYNNAMSLVEATVAQQNYVDQLCNISTAENMDEKTIRDTLKTGRGILEKLQHSRYMQTTPVQDSIKELYLNIRAILRFYNMKPFEIDSPFWKRSNDEQDWNRHKVAPHQVVDENLVPAAALNENHQKELAILNQKLLEKEKREKKLEDIYTKACFKITELENSIDSLIKEQKVQDSLKDFLISETERQAKEIEGLKPRKVSGTIQLYHSHSGNTIKDIETLLKALLKNQLNDIAFIKCSKLSEVDNSSPLIVLSIIASRVGTDAANALKGVPCSGKTALLLFHIKEIHALTKQASTAVLTDRSFKELGGIFDMAFVNGKGIYQCEMNDNALKGVCAFIKNVIYGTGI